LSEPIIFGLNGQMLIAIAVVHLIAVVDVWTSRLSRGAKVLWTLNILFLIVAGLYGWLLTRHSAHRPLGDTLAGGDHSPLT
jgi:hypothetical protein